MSWALVLGLAAAAYGLKALGVFVVGERELPPALARCVAVIPAAMLAAIVVKDTFTDGRDLVVDARLPGLAVAVLLAVRRVPFVVVVVAGTATTALVRLAA